MEDPKQAKPGKQLEAKQDKSPLGIANQAYKTIWLDNNPYTNMVMLTHLLDCAGVGFADFFAGTSKGSLTQASANVPKISIMMKSLEAGYPGVPELWNRNHGICTSFCIRLAQDLLKYQVIHPQAINLSFFTSPQHRLAAFVPKVDINIYEDATVAPVPPEVIVLCSSERLAFLIEKGKSTTLTQSEKGKTVNYGFIHTWKGSDRSIPKKNLDNKSAKPIHHTAYKIEKTKGFEEKWKQAMNTCLKSLLKETNVVCLFRSQHADGRLGFQGQIRWDFAPPPDGHSVSFTIRRKMPDNPNDDYLWGFKVEFKKKGDGADEASNKIALDLFSDFCELETTVGQEVKRIGVEQMPKDGDLYNTNRDMWQGALDSWGWGIATWVGPKGLEPKVPLWQARA